MVKFSFKNSIINTLVFVSTYLTLTNNVNAYSYTKNISIFTDKELNNPYIGWFHGATTIDLNDYPNYDCNYINKFTNARKLKPGLQYLGVRLAAFRDKDISDNALTALRNLLEEYRKQRIVDPTLQIILRFYYDGGNNYKADSSYKPIKINNKRKRSEPISDFEIPTFQQLDNGEINLTYDDYKYFKKEYNSNILDENENDVKEDLENDIDKKEENPLVEYYDSNGNLKTIELNDEKDTLADLKLSREDQNKLKSNIKFNNEAYYNEFNELSLSKEEFEKYENNTIYISDVTVNDIVNSNYEKREYEDLKENVDIAMFNNLKETNPIAKELYLIKLERVIKHIVQLSDIVNEYKDLIYIYQGAFVGKYDEMHKSNFLDSENLGKIVNIINELFDPSIFLSVRRPDYYRDLEKSFKKNTNFNYKLYKKRMGLYNDGLFYQSTDYGTYRNKNRTEEVIFQNELCAKVPNGGEGCIYKKDGEDYVEDQAKYNKFEFADEHARNIHLSYLNDGHSSDLLNNWKAVSGSEISNRYPNWNVNARDCIGRHLGYRYFIEDSYISDNQYLNINIMNVGYSPSYVNFDVKVYLVEKTSQKQKITGRVTNDDTRKWVNDKTITLQFDLNSVKNKFKYRTYDAYIRVFDKKTNYAIKFGIDNEENAKYGYKVGTITI
ncbi:hypothetical protein PIROE2DRAFT_1104 [Piromyces sp. E2]|nr:hypothetical protein PIROE2DRAFT_1104 [Piromyces sp. E2]|eukprot:OUM70586.1 hypothetical protein PIROE2DRAFT_1104 [Piromyces sp. E2]